MKRLSTMILTLLAAAQMAFAQASITVDAPKAVAVDEQFNLTFTVEGEKPSSFEWPGSSDFKLVWGPQQGSSTSISIVNGKTTRTVTSSYTYILMPLKEGQFTIPAATAKVKGNTISSKAFEITVAKGGASTSTSAPSSDNAYSISGDDIFMRMTLSRREVVVGEPITATIKLYERVGVAGFEDVRFPAFDGFWSQAVDAPTNVNFQRETVGDQIYNAAVLRSFSLIPQQSGDLEIDPAEMVCLVNVRSRKANTGSIFDSFFQDDYTTVRKRVSTKPVTVHVKPLPQPQPASFCGGVGKFSMDARMSKDSLAAHDAASLIVTVKGKGNLSLLEAPKVKLPADFEVYDVKTTDKGDSKVFEYPFIPRHHGDFTMDPVKFSYYDPASGKYVTLASDSLHVQVSKVEGAVEGGPAQSQFVGVAGRDVKNLGTDIRYIFTGKPSLKHSETFFVLSPAFFVLLAVLVLLAVVALVLSRSLAARRSDVAGARRRGASKMARKRLAKAGEYMSQDLKTAYYEELHKALLGFVADRLGMDASEQDKDTIAERLVAEGASKEDADEFTGLLDTCEYARYSPDSTGDAMKTSYESALRTISALDDTMKRKKTGRGGAAAAAVLALLMVAPFSADAQTDSLWVAGTQAYSEGNWDEARSAWEQIATEGLTSPQLCYNIGCACFKAGDTAHSILWFERALKMDPSYSDARNNLEYAEIFTQDRIESVPEFFLARWMKSLRNAFSSNGWAVACTVLFALFLAMLVMFLRTKGAARIVGFFAGILALLLSVGALAFSCSSRSAGLDDSRIVVTAPVSIVRSAPDANSGTDLFVLHEGTRARIIDEVGTWEKIELADGRQGWMKKIDFEII